MQLEDGNLHLTYCTNIHTGNGWDEVFSNLNLYAPALKSQFSPEKPFGLGLRLSSKESEELSDPSTLNKFRSFLASSGLYVAIINGFPYGNFHGERVKEDVFAPDWTKSERVDYTKRLINILSSILPEGVDGGVSTLPLSYKPWIGNESESAMEVIVDNLLDVTDYLARIREERGQLIHLDIEPEPFGLVENSKEVVEFFNQRLLARSSMSQELILEHIRVCLDTCHSAVEFEEPGEIFRLYSDAGIKIGRIQVSSALILDLPADLSKRKEIEAKLKDYADSTYLHQVMAINDDRRISRYSDLPEALPSITDPQQRQWRVHFHIPLFQERFSYFQSSQAYIEEVLGLAIKRGATTHFEIETYTWDVLPPDLKLDLGESISREFDWTLKIIRKLT